MKVRPYQNECIDCILQQFEDVHATLAVLATGLGKTVIFSTLAKRWLRGRVLILAHRDELIAQAADKVVSICGEQPAIEQAAQRADKSRVVVGSVPSVCRADRLERFDPDEFGLLVIDEAHHSVGTSYRTVIDHFRQNENLRVLGMTATPKRLDKLAMGQVYDSVAYEYGIEPASQDGWLVKVMQQRVIVDGLDFSKVRQTVDDLNKHDLEEVLKQESILHAIVAPTVKEAGDRPTLVFCVTVEHARLLSEVFNRYKPRSAAYVSGKTDRDCRREVIADYKAGKIQFLCNCGIFLEGFDAPTTSLICMARPTNSIGLYTQVVGRGTRVLPGIIDHLGAATPEQRRAAIAASKKPDMLILDFKGNAGKHKIVCADDLLGGKYAAPVKHYARQTAEKEGCAVGVQESLDRAEAELALLEEERILAEKRAWIKAEAEYRTQDISLFGGSAAPRQEPSAAIEKPKQEPPTPGQINYLVFLGVPRKVAQTYSKGKAGAVINSLKNKQRSSEAKGAS